MLLLYSSGVNDSSVRDVYTREVPISEARDSSSDSPTMSLNQFLAQLG